MNNFAEKKLLAAIKANIVLKRIRLDSLQINYIEAGEGKPVLLIHGANIGWGQWYRNISELSKYYKVYAFDLPGCGGSTKIDFHTSDVKEIFIQVVRDFIKRLGLINLNLVGHSIGGWICVKIAQSESIEKVVLINPLGFCQNVPFAYKPVSLYPLALFLSNTIMRPTRDNMKAFLASAFYDKTKLEDIFVNYYYESVHRGIVSHPFLLMNRITGFIHVKPEFMLYKDLLNINLPMLVLIGQKDPLTPVEAVRKIIDNRVNIRLSVISHTAHVPFLEKSEASNAVIHKFIA